MKADQIQVGGTYQAKVNNKLTTVRVDAIDETSSGTRYHVTNLSTNRKTIFKSAAKFRSLEGEQRPNPTDTIPTQTTETEIVTGQISSCDKPADVVIDTSFSKSNVFKQWEEAKAKHPEMIVLFRMGDFYEAYGDDAKTLGKVLSLTVTNRAELSMSGFPHHQLETYLHKLLREGHRVAICEQVEEKEIKQSLKSEGEQSRPFPVPSVESLSPSPATSSPTSSKSGLASRLLPKEDKAPHVIVEALAGSGKTTTLIEGLRYVMGWESKLTPSHQQRQVWDSMTLSKGIAKTVGMCAFNKAIATELQSRVPQGVEALTMHSMGFRAIRKSFPRVDAGDRGKWRVNNFLCDILGVDSREVRKDPKLSALVRTTETLVALAKMNLTCMGLPKTNEESVSTRASLNDLIEYYDIDVNGSKDKILDLIPQIIERCKDVGRDNLIDFNDMVWLPVALDLPMQQYDMLLVDECVPGNTLVTLADGSQIEIRKMVESDKEFSVKAFNINTGKNKACRVLAKQKIPNNKPMVRIQSRKRRSTKSDVETIECTVDHLIWTTNREWVNAGSISPKDKLLTTSGQVSIVYSVEPYVMDEEYVYDITVENCHNFYANGILVHNCQDLSKVQQELALRSGKRLIFVGDKKQSIYSFAGSDSKSMESLHERLGNSPRGLQVIPLTVTRRCGKAIVKEAQAYVPAFEAHESNPEGVITEALYTLQKTVDGLEELPWEKTYGPLVKAGDMVLCRHNAPLVSQCFKFLKRGIKANIQGRDVGQGLSSLIRKLAGKEYDGGDKPMPIAEFVGKLDDWLHAEIDKEQAKKHPNENRIVGLQDKVDCILAFSDGVTNTTQILSKIDSVFTDDRKSPGVRFSSGHKAKGLEARRVFILDPIALRFQRKKQADWEREQNNNLRYVMITRAIEELCYVV
jgi:superfamily I DNA/RNA helicase